MRASAFLPLALCFGLALGACDNGDDQDDHGSCSDADAARADDILDLVGDDGLGAGVFMQTCGVSACHGADGNAGPAPDLAEEAQEFDAEGLACLLLTGQGPMPSQSSLSDQELADVIAYVQATF